MITPSIEPGAVHSGSWLDDGVWDSDHGQLRLVTWQDDGVTTLAGVDTDQTETVFTYSAEQLSVEAADDTLLLVQAGDQLRVLDPDAGEEIWALPLTDDQRFEAVGRGSVVLRQDGPGDTQQYLLVQ